MISKEPFESRVYCLCQYQDSKKFDFQFPILFLEKRESQLLVVLLDEVPK